ncbi:MAG: GC-type dockerin domain-anchored protein [Phycisphaerales bacterium]
MHTPITARLPVLAGVAIAAPAFAQSDLIVFVHDQISDEILRLQDLNNDGDAHDPGEVTLFFDDGPPITGVDNAQGMVALDPWTLLATDNFKPDNIVRLEDLNRDGDAFDASENGVWFSGALPSGGSMVNPADLLMRPDGTFFLLDNNTLDTSVPEAIYILEDLNSDNDVDDPGEITLFHELSPAGVSAAAAFDVAQDNSGNVYTLDISDANDIESIDIIDPAGAARNTWLDSAQLFSLTNLVMSSTVAELEHNPETDEIIFGAATLSLSQRILAAKDLDGSGTINSPSEIRLLWSEASHADAFSTGSPRDFCRLPDGRLLWTDGFNDRVMLHQDLNDDGDFNDLGETAAYFDAAVASANGLPSLSLPLSVAAVTDDACVADFASPFGTLDFFDVSAFINAFNAQDPAADLAAPFGTFDFFDVSAFIGAFSAGCP